MPDIKDKKPSLKKTAFLVTPILLILTFIIYLYLKNSYFFGKLDLVYTMLIFSAATVVLNGIVYAIVLFFVKNDRKKDKLAYSIFFTSLIILFFAILYMPIKEFVLDLIGEGFTIDGLDAPIFIIGADKILFPFYVIVFAFVIILSRKFPQIVQKVNHLFFYTTAALLLMIVANALIFAKNGHNDISQFKSHTSTIQKQTQYPDIYYLIVDTYARNDVLQNYDGFDNSVFTGFLKAHDFYIADKSRCNFPVTFLSVNTSLNMRFPDVPKDWVTNASFQTTMRKSTQLNKCAEYLINNGYQYVPIGFYFFDEPFSKNPSIHIQKGYKKYGNLPQMIIISTPLEFLQQLIRPQINDKILRYNILLSYEQIENSIAVDSPKFVVAHLWGGHPPFIFEEDGTYSKDLPPIKPADNKPQYVAKRRAKYIEQIKYTNNRLSTIVDKIVKSDSSAIIILQADHGEWNVDTLMSTHDFVHDTSFLAQRMPILNAYRVPQSIRSVLYDSISPVNSFRIILDKLGVHSDTLVEDKHNVVWWTDGVKNKIHD